MGAKQMNRLSNGGAGGPSPSEGRIEEDVVRRLDTSRTSHRHLPAALPIAIVGILFVSSIAFGANFVQSVLSPSAGAGAAPAVVVESPDADASLEASDMATEDPGDGNEPSGDPSAAPTLEPTAGAMTLTAAVDGCKVKLAWSAYVGSDFAYYKVVRSADASAAWPLEDGDTLVAAIDNVATLAFKDGPGAGTFTYQVFAVKSSASGYEVLVASNSKTATPGACATKPPVGSNPADMGALRAKDNGDGSWTFCWNAYTGPVDISYYKLDGQPYPKAPGYVENGHYWAAISPSETCATVDVAPGTWNVNVEAVYYPDGAVAAGRTDTLKIVSTESGPTAPPVQGISLSASVHADGVHLSWGKYSGPYFGWYKVVRSEATAEPTYPLNGDSVLLAAITNVNVTGFVDSTAEPGHTYHYRIVVYTETALTTPSVLGPNCVEVGTVIGLSPVRTVTVTAITPPPASEPPATEPPVSPAPGSPSA
jgi:hypothetical protein